MSSLRILLVEDEAVVAMDVEERLARMGYAPVGRAQSGDEAIALTSRLQPDVVVMDIQINGDMDGITAASEINRRFSAPVIFLTAHHEEETIARARLVSPYSYLVKPIKDSDLKSAIEIAFHRFKADRELKRVGHLMAVLSQLNKTVLVCQDRQELFDTACRLLVEQGHIDLARIDWRDSATSRVRRVASASGSDQAAACLRDENLAVDAHAEGHGNPNKALHEGRPFVCNKCPDAGCLFPSDRKPVAFGLASCGSFPIRFQGEIGGVISLADGRPGMFQEAELALIDEVVLAISFALERIEAEGQQRQLVHALTVARDEAEQLNRSRQEVEERRRALLASMSDMVFVVDSQRTFIEYHLPEPARPLIAPAQFIGRRFDEVGFPEPARGIILQALDRTLQAGVQSSVEYSLEMEEGRRWFSLHTTPLGDGAGGLVGVTCVARDITEQHLREAVTATRAQLLELATHATTEVILRAALDAAEEHTGSRIGFYHFLLPDQVTLSLQAWSTATVHQMMCRAQGAGLHYPVDTAGVWVDCIRERGPVIHNDYAALSHRKGLPPGHAALVREVVVPVMRDGTIVALLGVGNKPTEYGAADVELLSALADLSWDITERRRLQDEMQQLNATLEQRVAQRTAELSLEVAERREAQAALSIKNVVFYSSLAATCIADPSGFLTEANEAFVRMWQYPNKKAIIGKSISHFLSDPADAAVIVAALQRTDQWQGEYLGKRCDGSVVFAHSFATTLRDEQGSLLGFQATTLDISDRKAAEQEQAASNVQIREISAANREMAARALAASTIKNRFFANMSHEIRTPLNAIIGFAQLLRNDVALSPVQRKRVETINDAGDQLLDLLSDGLDLAKIEAGTQELNSRTFDLRALLDELASSHRKRAEAKGLAFEVHGLTNVPQHVAADRNKLRQILENLLANAVKFTDDGKVQLHAQTIPEGPDGLARLVVRIADTGPGISADEMPFLFRPFEQAMAGRRHEQGTGLGLAICRQLARLMGGDVGVDSEVGRGSVFRVEVPINTAPDLLTVGDAPADEVLRIAPGQPRCRVLVVDDTASNRRLLVEMLTESGFDIFEAVDGSEMLAALPHVCPDLVIMDHRMPGMPGDEAIRRIRATAGHSHIKIITVTASATEESRQKSLDAGADDFLVKPFRHAELLSRIGLLTGVQYASIKTVRTTTETLSERGAAVARARVALLPANLRQRIAEASVRGRHSRLLELIRPVADTDPEAGEVLHALVARFDYETLRHLVQPDASEHAQHLP